MKGQWQGQYGVSNRMITFDFSDVERSMSRFLSDLDELGHVTIRHCVKSYME